MPLSTKLPAGKLRWRVQVVAPSGNQDTFGGIANSEYQSVTTCWAAIEALSARDQLAAQTFVPLSTYRITVRYQKDANGNCLFTAKQRILFRNRTFLVQGVLNPDERTKMLYLMCIEVADSAFES